MLELLVLSPSTERETDGRMMEGWMEGWMEAEGGWIQTEEVIHQHPDLLVVWRKTRP